MGRAGLRADGVRDAERAGSESGCPLVNTRGSNFAEVRSRAASFR